MMKKIKQEIFDIASSSSYSEMQLKFDIFSCKVNVQDLIDIFNIILKKDFAKADNFIALMPRKSNLLQKVAMNQHKIF